MTDNQQKYWDKIMSILSDPENSVIFWVSDLCALIPLSTQQFYNLFPATSDEFDTIKAILEKNRINLNKSVVGDLVNQSNNGQTTASIYLNKITQSKEQKEHMQELKEQETTEKPAPISVNFLIKNKENGIN